MTKPVYTHARLACGKVVPLSKECDCITHEGPHWLHADCGWHERNRKLIEGPGAESMLAHIGFAQEEMARLRELRWQLESRKIVKLLEGEE